MANSGDRPPPSGKTQGSCLLGHRGVEEAPQVRPHVPLGGPHVLVNKVDLLEHLDFDLEQSLGNLDAVNPGVERLLTSARTGQGVDEWCSWLKRRGAPL